MNKKDNIFLQSSKKFCARTNPMKVKGILKQPSNMPLFISIFFSLKKPINKRKAHKKSTDAEINNEGKMAILNIPRKMGTKKGLR